MSPRSSNAGPPIPPRSGHRAWRAYWHEVIFEADTPAGKAFDIALLGCIVLSVIAVLLESVASIRAEYGPQLRAIEWGFTALFTVEYLARLASVTRPWSYASSPFGLIDLCAILPTYLSVFFAGGQSLLVIRALRLLRVFRVLKLVQFVGEAWRLQSALHASMRKIVVFVSFVLINVLIIGAVMYLVEGEANGFTSIPQSIYWAIVTLTTVGYGDVAPGTVLGKILASMVMILGYGVIAVPTGIVTVELAKVGVRGTELSTQACPQCSAEGHDLDARYCRRCGAEMNPKAN